MLRAGRISLFAYPLHSRSGSPATMLTSKRATGMLRLQRMKAALECALVIGTSDRLAGDSERLKVATRFRM